MLNNNEKKVVAELRKDSRQRFTQISRNTGLHKLTVAYIEKQLRGEGVIRHVPLLDFGKMGYSINVLMSISGHSARRILKDCANVNNLQTTDSGKMLAEAHFGSMLELHELKEKIERVSCEVDVFHIIDTLKSEGFQAL
jgi:DNA-binding Lrp family transcriptional regulator